MTGREDQAELMSPDMESQILGCYAKTCTPEKIKVKTQKQSWRGCSVVRIMYCSC